MRLWSFIILGVAPFGFNCRLSRRGEAPNRDLTVLNLTVLPAAACDAWFDKIGKQLSFRTIDT